MAIRKQYKVQTIRQGEYIDADGVIVNDEGSWLGEVEHLSTGPDTHTMQVQYFTDEGGDYIPAPEGWESNVIFEI